MALAEVQGREQEPAELPPLEEAGEDHLLACFCVCVCLFVLCVLSLLEGVRNTDLYVYIYIYT